jgi:predicted amidohydrolase YtcJ
MDEKPISHKISRRRFLQESGMAVSGLLYGCTRLGKQMLEDISSGNSGSVDSANSSVSVTTPADFILRNGKVLTMNSTGSKSQAIALKGDRILAVGSDKDMVAFTGGTTKVMDVGGKVITPGLIDPHNHFRLVGLQNSYYTAFMPPEVTNTQTMQQALREFLKTKKPGEWVQAYYLVLQDNMTPDKSFLDPVSPDNPVFLFHIGGHWGTANSAALKIANVTASTKSPEGGIIQKDANGQPNGLLYNHRAMDVVRRFAPPIEPELVSRGILETQAIFAACGVTSFQDNNVRSLEDIAMYRQLTEEGKLFLRNDLYLTLEWPSDLKNKVDVQKPFDNGVTRFKGYKFLIDGQTPTAYCHQPHNGTAWDISTWEPEEFKRTVQTLHDTGLQICTHCVGDAAADLALDAYEAAMNANPRSDPRHRIEHAILTTKKATQRMKDLGVVVSTNPHFLYIGGDSYENIFGAQLADRIMVTREWLDAGVHVTIGSDAPTTPFYTPQATMAGAITRLTYSRKALNKEQSLTIDEALKAHTYEGAYAAHEELEKGSLEPGKLADIVIWDEDPTQQSIADLVRTTKVNMTMVGGKVVFQA